MLSKLFYFRIFIVWMLVNPAGVLFGLSTAAALALGTRLAIHPQIQTKPSLDRELGEMETHLQSTDDRAKAAEIENDHRLDEITHDREGRKIDTDKWRATQTALLEKISGRFDVDELDQRLLRERIIGDEKLVFGFVLCVSFLGGSSFIRKYFASRATIGLTSVDVNVKKTKKVSSYTRPTKRRTR
jgi:hypothetical protein